ncbi:universal stress protein [Caballeronia humi]|uniref:Universal stress family protein n=2 Tax=Caballeronia TaxID=1827195 RepID=A0A158J006_9BURK|nr:universal stress protein [Caballeronia humi]SAL61699.1 universal stress family protein [Caballeronia humi]
MSTKKTSTTNMAPDTAAGFQRILLCVDSSLASERAADFVRNMMGAGAQVRIIGVVENPRVLIPTAPLAGLDLSAARAELMDDMQNALAKAHASFAQSPAAAQAQLIDLAKHGGDVAHAIADAARDFHADLLVLGSRQHHGLLRWVEGTVSEPVMRLAECAIIVVPAHCEKQWSHAPQRLLFAIDGSDTSQEALRIGARLAGPGAQLKVIYVVDRAVRFSDFVPITLLEDAFVQEGNASIARAREVLAQHPNVAQAHVEASLASTDMTSDDIAHTIVREAAAWGADLVVMGTHGRRGPARWMLGSVAGRVARVAETPLMLVRKSV